MSGSRLRPLLVLTACALALASACSSAAGDPAVAARGNAAPAGLTVPKGWTLSVFARVPGARLAVWAPDHRLLVSRPGSGDVQAITPDGTVSTLVGGLRQPHGLAFHGNTLYVAESNQIDTFSYANGTTGAKHVLVPNLPDAQSPELGGQYAHALKSVVVGRTGTVFFSIGSTGNISPDDRTANPQRATIMQFRNGRVSVVARGVRNGTGLALDPSWNLWTAVNNRDNIAYPYRSDWDGDGNSDYGRVMQSYVNDHPMEELAKVTPGRDLGWPYCNPEVDTRPGVNGSPQAFATRPFTRDQDTNADRSKLDCRTLTPIEQGFPAHSAPLGLSFANLPRPFGRGALVATHGSWNRTPPRAPTVAFFPWSAGHLGARQVLVGGFQRSDGSRVGRPVAAIQSPWSGAVYITDDAEGVVYRLQPPG